MFDFWLPSFARAAADLTPLRQFILKIEMVIINPIIQLGFAVALLVFLYGVFEFIKDGESSTAREKGGQHILWGILGMFIMIAAGGIMQVICGSWGITSDCNPF
ncbi:MAG: hypothetical protein KA028_01630 [Candidatus Pacebacteria bacterium]|nr:hypothetical protein [Candidatus Paceibacterota bacterium]